MDDRCFIDGKHPPGLAPVGNTQVMHIISLPPVSNTHHQRRRRERGTPMISSDLTPALSISQHLPTLHWSLVRVYMQWISEKEEPGQWAPILTTACVRASEAKVKMGPGAAAWIYHMLLYSFVEAMY